MKSKLAFGMAKGNVELKHECCSQHFSMETARMKKDKITEEANERRSDSMEKSKAHTK